MTMYTVFEKKIGRIGVRTSNIGDTVFSCLDGYNDQCPVLQNNLSHDELRDLKYMVDRALEALADKK